jgi:hypothetical protein
MVWGLQAGDPNAATTLYETFQGDIYAFDFTSIFDYCQITAPMISKGAVIACCISQVLITFGSMEDDIMDLNIFGKNKTCSDS